MKYAVTMSKYIWNFIRNKLLICRNVFQYFIWNILLHCRIVSEFFYAFFYEICFYYIEMYLNIIYEKCCYYVKMYLNIWYLIVITYLYLWKKYITKLYKFIHIYYWLYINKYLECHWKIKIKNKTGINKFLMK